MTFKIYLSINTNQIAVENVFTKTFLIVEYSLVKDNKNNLLGNHR